MGFFVISKYCNKQLNIIIFSINIALRLGVIDTKMASELFIKSREICLLLHQFSMRTKTMSLQNHSL